MHDTLVDGSGTTTLLLAHGAGAPMDSDFMEFFATRLAEAGVRVVRFEFPYMAERRIDGKKRGPNSEAILRQTWAEVIEQVRADEPEKLVIGGKSMGGRYATMVAEDHGVDGVVVLGYPFHPPGKPEKLRTDHLRDLEVPTLIVQGERDPFGTREEVGDYDLSSTIVFEWAKDGDHSLEPRKRSGFTQDGVWTEAVASIRYFVKAL